MIRLRHLRIGVLFAMMISVLGVRWASADEGALAQQLQIADVAVTIDEAAFIDWNRPSSAIFQIQNDIIRQVFRTAALDGAARTATGDRPAVLSINITYFDILSDFEQLFCCARNEVMADYLLVDAETIRDRAEDPLVSDTVDRQLEAADIIVLNKCDLVDSRWRGELRAWLSARAPEAALVEASHGRVPMSLLSMTAAARLGRSDTGMEIPPTQARDGDAEHHHDHDHQDHGSEFRTVTLPMPGKVDMARLKQVLRQLPSSVLRIKGFVDTLESGPERYLVQVTGRRADIQPWMGGGSKAGLVIIGDQNLPDEATLTSLFDIRSDHIRSNR